MRATQFVLCLVSIAAVVGAQVAPAHGGAYRGAGDTTPPGSSGGGGASTTARPSRTSGSAAASAGSGPQPGSGPTGPSSGAPGPSSSTATSADSSRWQLWWGFNREAYLNLKAALYQSELIAGSDDAFLGKVPFDQARDRLQPSSAVVRDTVVPGLIAVLADERDNDIVTGVLVALAKIGDAPTRSAGRVHAADVIRPFLADANQEIAETAAVSLGILADPGEVPLLEGLLLNTPAGRACVSGSSAEKHEVHWRTRAFAAFGLGLVGYRNSDPELRRRIVQSLSTTLEGDARGMATPDVALACLTAIGLVPLPILVDPSVSLSAEERRRPEVSRQAQIDWLLALSRDERNHWLVRAHAPTALVRLLSNVSDDVGLRARVAADLMEILAPSSKAHREVCASSILALGSIGDADSDPSDAAIRACLMAQAADGRDTSIRCFAMIALARSAGRNGARTEESDAAGEVSRFLLKALADGRSTERPWAALALGVLDRARIDAGRTRSVEIGRALRAALESARSPREIGAYCIALGIRRDAEAREILCKKLDELGDDEARGFVTLGLGLMGAREAIGAVQAVVQGARYRPELLREAAVSLGLLGDKTLVPDLVSMLREAKSLSTQAAIASALGAIGDARSIAPLIEMLENRELTPRARAFAAVALGIVADKEPSAWNAKLSVGINYHAQATTLTDGQGAGILDIL